MDNNQQAVEYIKKHQFAKAVELLNNEMTEHPEDPLAYINFGNVLLQMNDDKHAENFFKKALELDDEVATAYYSLGNIYYRKKSFTAAQQNYQKAIQLGLEDGDVYYMLGMSFKEAEQDRLALPFLLRATELSPKDNEILFQYGLTLAQTNYLSEAQDVFEQILVIDAHHADAHYNLGVIALFHDQSEVALTHFEEALSTQPEHVLAANGKKQVLKALEE